MNSPLSSSRLVIASLAVAIVAQLVFHAYIWSAAYQHPKLAGNDFSLFHVAGQTIRQGNAARLYDIDLQREMERPLRMYDRPFANNHPPHVALIAAVVTTDDYHTSFITWTLFCLGALAISAVLLFFIFREVGWDQAESAIAALAVLTLYPVSHGLIMGQDSALLLLGALLYTRGAANKSDLVVGLSLILVAVKPQIALALGLVLLAARPRAFLWAAFAGVSLLLLSLWMVGVSGLVDYANIIRITAEGDVLGMNQLGMLNLLGCLLRVGVAASLAQSLAWAAFLAVTALVGVWFYFERGRLTARHAAIAVACVTFFSPHLHTHDLCLLCLPLAVLMTKMTQTKALLLAVSASLLLFVTQDTPVFVWAAVALTVWITLALFCRNSDPM